MARTRTMSVHAWIRPCTTGSGIWHSFVTVLGKTERLSTRTRDRDKAVTFNLLHSIKAVRENKTNPVSTPKPPTDEDDRPDFQLKP